NVLKVEDDRTLTRQRDPAVRHRQQAGVRATHPEDLLQPEGEAGARGERVDRWSAGEASPELLLQRRDVALDGPHERVTDGGSDGLVGVDVGDVGPIAAELDPRSRGHGR